MKYDYIVVGAGLAGGILARKLAESGKHILIVERRNQLLVIPMTLQMRMG